MSLANLMPTMNDVQGRRHKRYTIMLCLRSFSRIVRHGFVNGRSGLSR